ncbi:MAG: carboxypeptidase regulatory-like domain-containing protein [Acidobacteriota bacterium]
MKKFLAVLVVSMVAFGLGSVALAQQTGSIEGKVTLADGSAVAGVAVEARSDVLPQPRTTTTGPNGEYRLPLLPPGEYQITYKLGDLAPATEKALVLLQQTTTQNVTLSPEAVTEAIEVVAEGAPTIDTTSSELKTAITEGTIDALPVGQEYRDLIKLIPGVQYTEDNVRGPSAGGSGQDNAYQFDGVNVALPLFGTLSAEPSSHDIDQIAIVKGGANAVDFNRSGGFTINSVSKSGTNSFHGQASYQLQPKSTTSSREKSANTSAFDDDKDWATLSAGGPVVRDRLFFYGSYYRPTAQRENTSNAYGSVPDFKSTRDEYFGKLSYTPLPNVSLNGSYRDSSRESKTASVGSFAAATTALGEEATLGIAIAEGSWIVNDKSFASFKYTDFKNETSSRPDLRFGFLPAFGQRLDIANLENQGLFNVPLPLAGQTAFNNFIAPLIQRYGFDKNGVRTGGGQVGAGSTESDDDFFRQSYQAGWNYLFGERTTHEIHLGYKYSKDEEDLQRTSNGFGSITVPGGRTSFNGKPIFFEAAVDQMGLPGGVPLIHSEFVSHSVEINDQIRLANWTFNLGVLASNDVFYGQGLKETSGNLSGFALAPGHKYKMYDIGFGDMIQPRLGATWAYNGRDTLFVNYARYNPAASSLPRAAAWDRNLARTIRFFFAADGSFIGSDPLASSSGKFFDDDLDPRRVEEYLIGTSRQLSARWVGRVHARYRYANNFWEDTNNDARIAFNAPAGIPHELYVPNLPQVQREIGGSSYVIAELDGAFTKYYEASVESEYRGNKTYFRGSYVWSHYYGNFDQDNSTTDNDQAIFVGSSNLADGAGRQLWNKKYGNLRGDRRHQLKVYGSYDLGWKASVGAFAIYQSGQPWETWDVEVYRALTTSTSDVNRNAEPAGSHTTDAHYQVDLNYTQNVSFGRYNVQLRADLFNATNNQTGYNIQNQKHSAGFGTPKTFYDPRRLQLGVKFEF